MLSYPYRHLISWRNRLNQYQKAKRRMRTDMYDEFESTVVDGNGPYITYVHLLLSYDNNCNGFQQLYFYHHFTSIKSQSVTEKQSQCFQSDVNTGENIYQGPDFRPKMTGGIYWPLPYFLTGET